MKFREVTVAISVIVSSERSEQRHEQPQHHIQQLRQMSKATDMVGQIGRPLRLC